MQRWQKYAGIGAGIAAFLYFAGPGCDRQVPETAHIAPVTEATFAAEVESAEGWVLVDFWAPWCGPCRVLLPDLDALAAEYAGRVRFVKVNVDENPRLTERFQVKGLPQVYLFRNGQVVTGFAGVSPRAEIRRWIDERITKDI